MIQMILNHQSFSDKSEHQKISSLHLKTKTKRESQLSLFSLKLKASESKQTQNRCSSNMKRWISHWLWKNYRKWNYHFSTQTGSDRQEITLYHHHQCQNHQFSVRRNLTQSQSHFKSHSTNHPSQSNLCHLFKSSQRIRNEDSERKEKSSKQRSCHTHIFLFYLLILQMKAWNLQRSHNYKNHQQCF